MVSHPLLHHPRDLRDGLPDDEAVASLRDRFHVVVGHHPGVRNDRHLGEPVSGHELLQHRQHGEFLGLVALELVDHQRKPPHIRQQADGDLGLQAAFLAVTRLPEPVTLIGLEIQGRHVVEQECGGAETNMGSEPRREPSTPLRVREHRQTSLERAIRR